MLLKTAVEKRLSHALSYGILLGGFLTITVSVYMVVATYSSLPFWDEWGQAALVAKGGSPLSPDLLWRQQNEHRLVIPMVFLAADLQLFQGKQVFLLASILAIQFLHLVLLS
jgi:hypothetical protein